MAGSRELKVEIIGDASSLNKALGSVNNTSSKLGSSLKTLGKVAAGAGVAVAAGFAYTLKRGFDELGDSQKVLAQTAAGIKSTGGAANVTAKQVEGLASSLSLMSGVDDEVIQQGENLLLTFTKVRNEVGKGNDVFNRATASALDLSVRGFGSVDSASKMLGKALQDPVKGITALSRAGVTFTEGQKESIKSLVEHGKQLEAQKLILKEVETQVGGSAKAYGETLPGQLAKARNAFDEVAGQLAAKLLPALTTMLEFVNKHFPQVAAVVGAAMDKVMDAVGDVAGFIRSHWEEIGTAARSILVPAFHAAEEAVHAMTSAMKTDLGQQVVVSAGAFAALAESVHLAGGAVRLFNKTLTTLKANPFWLALIPLGVAVGIVAQDFIKNKIEAQNLADAWDDAMNSANRLKSAMDSLAGKNLEVRQAQENLYQSTVAMTTARDATTDALAKYGPNSDQYTAALHAESQASINLERDQIALTDAKNAVSEASKKQKAVITDAASALLKLAEGSDKASNSGLQVFEITKMSADEAAKFAVKTRELAVSQDALAQKYRTSAPAASEAATKTAELARRLAELAVQSGKVPDRKTIIAEAKLIGGPAFAKAVQGIIGGADNAQKGAKRQVDKIPGHVSKAIGSAKGVASSESPGIATAITSGIESGFNFGGIIAIVRQGVRDAIEAGKNAGSLTKDYAAKEIGKPLTDGPAEQVKKDAPKLAEVTVASVRKAVGAARLEAAKALIGGPAVQKIIDDIVGKTPSLKAQFAASVKEAAEAGRQAIASAREGYASAFASLFQAGVDAIAAKYAGWQPPSLLKAQKEAEAREKAALLKSISDTQTELQRLIAESSAASNQLQALGIRPADLAEGADSEAQKVRADEQKKWDDLKAIIDQNGPKIVSAQQSLDDLLFQQRQKALAEKAAQEQKAHDKLVADEQENFGKRLQKIMASHRNINAKVQALLKEFNIDFLNAGTAWGNQLAAGIRAAKEEVKAAARELAQVLKDNLNPRNSPAKEGPLSEFDMYKAGQQFGMDWAAGMASATKTAGSAAGSVAGAAAGNFTRGGGKPGGTKSGSATGNTDTFAPAWADPEIWASAKGFAIKEGQYDNLMDSIATGGFTSNGGLLDQLFRRRSRWNWNDWSPRMARMFEMMAGPEGMSGKEVASYFGLLKKGGTLPGDGFYYGHKGETVVPPYKGGSMRPVVINFHGPVLGTEEQLTRKIIEGIRREQTRGAPSIIRGR